MNEILSKQLDVAKAETLHSVSVSISLPSIQKGNLGIILYIEQHVTYTALNF